MLGSAVLSLVQLASYGLFTVRAADLEYDRFCVAASDREVTLPSGYRFRYLCDDCPIDASASQISGINTIEECADLCNTGNCKGTMWDSGRCYTSHLKYLGDNQGSGKASPGCIWMTAQRYFDGKDDCTVCLEEKQDCEDKKKKCNDDLTACKENCKAGDKDCEAKKKKCQDDLAACKADKDTSDQNAKKCEDELKKCKDNCKAGDEDCEKKKKKCQSDLSDCEDEKYRCERDRKRCQTNLSACEEDRDDCEKRAKKCQDDLQKAKDDAARLENDLKRCRDDLDDCQDSAGSWGSRKIECPSGSMKAATFRGEKWFTLCNYVIKGINVGNRGITFEDCVQKCSEDDKCPGVTYYKSDRACYVATRIDDSAIRPDSAYDSVVRLK